MLYIYSYICVYMYINEHIYIYIYMHKGGVNPWLIGRVWAAFRNHSNSIWTDGE